MHPGPGARRTEHDVLEAWQNVAQALSISENSEDRDLGREIANFKGNLQTVARATYLSQQRKKQIEREKERLEKERRDRLAPTRQVQPERQVHRERQGPSR